MALSGASFAALVLAAGPGWAQSTDKAQGGADATTLSEVVVTGTSIRGVPPVGSNLIGVTRDDIVKVAVPNVPDLLATVPQLNSFSTAPSASLGGFGSFAPGLRGLPASATLPLMDGHRLAAAAANETNPDYPLIPSLALQRIEIVADGASSIYGSDAVAGVVNFITRRRVTGLEVAGSYGVADDYYSTYIGAVAGHAWSSGWIYAAYQYTKNDNIRAGDRDYRIQDFRPYGGIDTRATSCPSPNVLVDATFFAVNYAAPALAPNTANHCDNVAPADYVPSSRIHSVFVSGRQNLSERIALWGEVLYSDRHDELRAAPPVQAVLIPRTNPFFKAPPSAPGATLEYVQFRPDNLIGADHFTNTDQRRVLNSSFGFDVTLPRDLNLAAYGTYDWSNNDAYIPQINTTAITAAGFGTTTATALDPFGTGTSPSVVAAILNSSTTVSNPQRKALGAIKLDGPLATLPGGQLKFALGGEIQHQSFEQRGFVGATPVPENLERDVHSVYAELFIPILGAETGTPLLHDLSVSVSGRYDHYSDFGSTTNPKVGVNWRPLNGLTLRGSYGTSFRAPDLRQVGATVGSYYLSANQAATFANDPTRGAAQVNTVYLLGGNKGLQPEEATTYSFGADFNPTALPRLHASLTYYNIDFSNVIGTPTVPYVFTDPTFASLVTRNPTPAQLSSLLSIAVPVTLPTPLPPIGNVLDLRLNNFGIRDTDGLDFDVNYRWPTGFGAVYADVAGNHILNYRTRFSPGAPEQDGLALGVPRWTVRGTLGAEVGAVSATGFVNYRGGITNNYTTPTGVGVYSADAYVTVDLRLAWTLPARGWAKGTVLGLQVDNLFDADPPFFPATDGIGGTFNPIGRFVAVNLRKTF